MPEEQPAQEPCAGFWAWGEDYRYLPDTFVRKVLPDPATGCWVWQGGVTGGQPSRGREFQYGNYWDQTGQVRTYAHRFSYKTLVGPITAGLQLDHLCRRPICCNPAHLEPVTPRENTRRGEKNGRKPKKTCLRGHPYEGENVRVDPRGLRHCRSCEKILRRDGKNILS